MENPETHVFDSAQVVDERFDPRDDYNPFNEAMFPEVIFSLSTRDGRVREPNAA